MANSKIPNINATDTLNTFRLRTNQLLDSVGDVSTLTTTATDVTGAVNEHDSELGTISAAAMGTTAATVGTAINELDGRLDSINNTELLSLRATLRDSSATSLIKGKLQVDTDLHVGGNTTLGGSITVDGEVTFKAGTNSNINLGDSNVDNIVFNADVNSNIIPNTNNTFDLGADSQQWRDVYVDGTVKTDNLAADSATITGDLTASGLIVATYIKHAGDLDTAIDFGDNSIALQTGGTTRVSINNNRFMILEDLLVTDSAYITGTVHAGNLVSLDSLGVGGNMSVQGTATLYGPLTGLTTAAVYNTASTTVNFAGEGTAVNIGAATGTTTINHNLDVSGITSLDSTNVVGELSVTGNLAVTEGFTVGGSFTTTGAQKSQASYALLNNEVAVSNVNRAGVAIDRPGLDSALLQWNELGDYWEAGLTSDLKRLALQNDSANFTNIYQTGTAATRIPAGTTGQRPSGAQGQIRYNTSQSSFEGYSGASWGSLGGLVDVNGDTKIIAERSASNDSDTLTFFAGGTEVARMNDSGTFINTDLTFPYNKTIHSTGLFSPLTVAGATGNGQILNIKNTNNGIPRLDIMAKNDSSSGGNVNINAGGNITLLPVTGNIEFQSGDSHGLVVDIASTTNAIYKKGEYATRVEWNVGELEFNATNLDFNGVADFSSDVTIGGDLYVNGNTTYVNTTQMQIADNVLDLNHDVTGTPTSDAGIAIRRGTSDSAVLTWDESVDYWTAGTVGARNRIATVDYLNASDGVSFDSASGKFAHADTSSQTSVTSDNSGNTFIQDISATLDTYGHVTGFTVATADVPASTNTTYTTTIAASTTKLRLTGSDSTSDDIEFVGSGATTVTRTNDSKFTISSTDTDTVTALTQIRSNTDPYRTGNITLKSGTNCAVSESPNGTFTFTSTDTNTNTTYTAGDGLTLNGTVFDANVNGTNTTAANAATTTASRTYKVQVDASDQLVVNVPWSGDADASTSNELRFKTTSGTINNLRMSGNDVHIDGGLVVGNWTTTAVDNEVRALGDITAYVSSDITLKENIVEINNAMDKISQIRGVYFDWTDEHIAKRGGEDGYFVHKADVGVIAQEVQAVLPEIVKERVDGTLAVEYQKMVALLIEGMKELKAEIQELKSGDK